MTVELAARDIADADYLLIVAAAGLSINDEQPNNPYHNRDDFARHYPTLTSYGYRTAFDAMGLARDESVPAEVKLAFSARHFLNMRFNFPPTAGYEMLRELTTAFAPERVFCWTSNVDACFERAGFDEDRVYTSQGQMDKYQCARPDCGHVWNVVDQLRAIDAAPVDGVLSDVSLAPSCPSCGSQWPQVRPNLRGGDWFIHKPYEEKAARLLEFLDACVLRRAKVAIVEVGVGANTPIVTRIPACAFASAVQANGGRAAYLRVNPDPPEGRRQNPADGVAFHRWRQTWRALGPLVDAVLKLRRGSDAAAATDAARAPATAPPQSDEPPVVQPGGDTALWQSYYRDILASLHTPRRE